MSYIKWYYLTLDVLILLEYRGTNVCSDIKVTSNLVWTQSSRESMDMWRRPRERLQSGGVDHGRWSGRSAKQPLLSAPFTNSTVHCNTGWLGNKTQAKMSCPHPLRSIKGPRLRFSLFKWQRDKSTLLLHFSLLVDTRNVSGDQSTECQSFRWEEMHPWDWELACLHTADC